MDMYTNLLRQVNSIRRRKTRFRLAIGTMSLGRVSAGHTLEDKLDMAKRYGYEGVEIHYEDLVHRAGGSWPFDSNHPPPSAVKQIAAAREIHQQCAKRKLEVVCLQPFTQFEGLLDRTEHFRRLDDLALWFRLAAELQTDLIAISSNFMPAEEVSGDIKVIVADLQVAADLAMSASPPIRLSFESLCWGTCVDTWEDSYYIVTEVNRPNFGICLDTFNMAGRFYADPTLPFGKCLDADVALKNSMGRLVAELDVRKIFYLQVADAERLQRPLVCGHEHYNPKQPARMSWSRNCRLFYGEHERGGYLPIKEISLACFKDLGYEGWVSMELYNSRMADKDEDVPCELAERGSISFKKLMEDIRSVRGNMFTKASTPNTLSHS